MFDVFLQYWWQCLLVAAVSYLLGAINFAVIFSRIFKREDIRKYGSGNPGTTNVFRVFGLRMGALTLTFDALKGVVCSLTALLIFRTFSKEAGYTAGYVAELFAVIGHVFPVFYKFRGGKGFATALGASFVLQPVLTACCILPICLIILISDRMSVAALSWSTFMIIWAWAALLPEIGAFCCVAVTLTFVIIIFAHRHNIVRILTGKEMRTGVRRALRGKSVKEYDKYKEEHSRTNEGQSEQPSEFNNAENAPNNDDEEIES